MFLIVSAGSGNTLATFNPASSLQSGFGGWRGVLFGALFAFLAFSGFESSATLGEESHNPRRIVPLSILLATIIIGVFYVFCAYAGVVGWGFRTITTYPSDPNPWGTMAARAWGPFAFIAILAILNSALGNANAAVDAGARIIISMGRIKAFPSLLGNTNKFRVPGLAIIVALVVGIIVMLWIGLVYGPILAFAFIGATLTVPIILVYMLTCLAVPFFYWREYRDEFSVWRHENAQPYHLSCSASSSCSNRAPTGRAIHPGRPDRRRLAHPGDHHCRGTQCARSPGAAPGNALFAEELRLREAAKAPEARKSPEMSHKRS